MNIQARDQRCRDPLKQLVKCHRQIQHSLHVLRDLVMEASQNGLPPPQKDRLEKMLSFLCTTMPRHMLDEEMSLFPRLEADPLGEIIIRQLKDEHRRIAFLFRAIETLGRNFLKGAHCDGTDREKFVEVVNEAIEMTLGHAQVEEQRLFPLAFGRLAPEALAQVGEEMASRKARFLQP